MGENWLLMAAMDRRQKDVIESRGRKLATDACDNGGRLRHRMSLQRRAPPVEAARVVRRPLQLALWG